MPQDCPGIVIVQHMPENFTRMFAERLNGLCQINVKEAEHNDPILPGHAYIAPGGKHLWVKRDEGQLLCKLSTEPPMNLHRPSVDFLFLSCAKFLGADAIGVFASDRPTAGFQASALAPEAAAAYARFAADWAAASKAAAGGAGGSAGDGDGGYGARDYGTAEYTIHGPAEDPTAEQDEEALAGYSAGWALFRHVLPGAAAKGGALDPDAVASAARAVDLPEGSLPNGAGLRFSNDSARLGQNERAAAVIWQWQAVRTYAFVWPPTYATGSIDFVPLAR